MSDRMSDRDSLGNRFTLAVLVFDAVLLALIELLFLYTYIGTVQFPITTALAAVSTPLLVMQAAAFSRGRLGTAAPLIGWVLALFVFGAFGPGGDVLLLAGDWRAYLLIAAGTLPGAVMLGIARGRESRRRAT